MMQQVWLQNVDFSSSFLNKLDNTLTERENDCIFLFIPSLSIDGTYDASLVGILFYQNPLVKKGHIIRQWHKLVLLVYDIHMYVCVHARSCITVHNIL